LLDVFWGDEADGVEVLEAGCEQFFQVRNFCFGGDEARETLPGVAWAFDEFDEIHWERKRDYNTEVTEGRTLRAQR
jgi:hypothetical protein